MSQEILNKYPALRSLTRDYIYSSGWAGSWRGPDIRGLLTPLSYDELLELANIVVFPVTTNDTETLRDSLSLYILLLFIDTADTSVYNSYKLYSELSPEDLEKFAKYAGLERYSKNRDVLLSKLSRYSKSPSVPSEWKEDDFIRSYAVLPKEILVKLASKAGLDTSGDSFDIAKRLARNRKNPTRSYQEEAQAVRALQVRTLPIIPLPVRAPRKSKSKARSKKSSRKSKSKSRRVRKSKSKARKVRKSKSKTKARKVRKSKSKAKKSKSKSKFRFNMRSKSRSARKVRRSRKNKSKSRSARKVRRSRKNKSRKY